MNGKNLLLVMSDTCPLAPCPRGRVGDRKAIVVENQRVKLPKRLHADESMEIGEICQTLKVSKATLYRYLGK